jgi:peptide/nickel transport system substrate-binding protein
VYDALYVVNPNNGQLTPRLATSLTTSDRGTTWTLQLRPNVKFADGTAYDANAVMFNWQRIANPANKAAAASYAGEIQSYSVVSPLTLQVTLKAPAPVFNNQVATYLSWIASPAAVQKEGASFGIHPVGAGAFILQSYIPNSVTTLTRNPNYWQAGEPYVNTLVVKTVLDPTQANLALQTGEAQIYLFENNLSTMDQLQKSGYQVVSQEPVGGGGGLILNVAKPPFDNLALRQAINLALNRTTYNTAAYSGSPQTLMTTLDRPGTPFYDASIAVPQQNLAQAQSLINQVVAQTGKPVEFTIVLPAGGTGDAEGQEIQGQLAALKNLKVDLSSVTSSTQRTDETTGNYQATLAAQNLTWELVQTDLITVLSSADGGADVSNFQDPLVDTDLKQLEAATSVSQQVPLEHAVEREVLKQVPYVFLSRYAQFEVAAKNVQNLQNAYGLVPLVNGIWLSK